jgi:hypothetical protein
VPEVPRAPPVSRARAQRPALRRRMGPAALSARNEAADSEVEKPRGASRKRLAGLEVAAQGIRRRAQGCHKPQLRSASRFSSRRRCRASETRLRPPRASASRKVSARRLRLVLARARQRREPESKPSQLRVSVEADRPALSGSSCLRARRRHESPGTVSEEWTRISRLAIQVCLWAARRAGPGGRRGRPP